MKAVIFLFALVTLIGGQSIEVNVEETESFGHAWAVISCQDGKATISFGPNDTENRARLLFKGVPSTLDFATGSARVSRAILLSEDECQQMLKQIEIEGKKEYRLVTQNCTTAVLSVLKAGGVDLNSSSGGLKKFLSVGVVTPNQLAKKLVENPPFDKPSQQNTGHLRLGWKCKYSGTIHAHPSQCEHPELGGRWVRDKKKSSAKNR